MRQKGFPKSFLFCVTLLLAATTTGARASTLGVFVENEGRATAAVRGNNRGDKDAENLYNKLMAPVELINGFFVKQIEFLGGDVLIRCAMSPRYAGLGTCTVEMRAGEYLRIDFARKMVSLQLRGEDCRAMAKEFFDDGYPNAARRDFYESTDKKLRGWATGMDGRSEAQCELDFRG